MSKSHPVNPLARVLSPRTSAATATTGATTEPTTPRATNGAATPGKLPTLKIRQPSKPAIPLAESDGQGVSHRPDLADDPADDQEAAESVARWETRFDAEVQLYTERAARQRKMQKARAEGPSIDIPEGGERFVAGQPVTEPQLQNRGRAATVREALRDGMQRLSRLSMTQDNMQALTLGDLARSKWLAVHPTAADDSAFPLHDKLPPKFMKALAMEYLDFQRNKRNEGLAGKERDDKLKEALAKKFLAMALLGPASKFDQSKIGSRSAINRYLANHFGVQIEQEPTTARNESSSARTRRASIDFRDQLALEAERRSRNYEVAWSIDLADKEADPFVSKVFAGTIEDIRKNETVSKTAGQRIDVTATFQRDFKNSVYEFEGEDGTVGKLASIDDFVAFVGDPMKSGLPALVSHYACQNLGMFIKNLLFAKVDDKGNPQSVLTLFDGRSLTISLSPKATYRLKKAADGTITLSYRSAIDTAGAAAQGKLTAQLLRVDKAGIVGKGVLIEDAQATTTLDIVFHPDGSTRMGKLEFNARGWNQLSE